MPSRKGVHFKKNWLNRQGLQFLEILTQAEQEVWNTQEGLFETLSNKFRPQHNETIKSCHYCKLTIQNSENAGEWMGRLRIAATECNYQEIHRLLKEWFINGLNDDSMLVELIHELTAIRDKGAVSSSLVLLWVRWVEAQKIQTTFLSNLQAN